LTGFIGNTGPNRNTEQLSLNSCAAIKNADILRVHWRCWSDGSADHLALLGNFGLTTVINYFCLLIATEVSYGRLIS
jgi:hypothetical protein